MKKIVSLLLAVLMVLSMLPVMAFADELQQIDLNAEEQQSEEENKAEEPESKMKNAVLLSGGVTVELKGVHSAQTASLKVYSYDGKVKGDSDFLEGNAAVADGYALKYVTELPEGDYWVEGYDSEGNMCGGIAITVNSESTSFEFNRVYELHATNSGWVYGTDYTIELDITGQDGTKREVTIGKTVAWGNEYMSFLFMSGDTINATFTPIGEKAATAMPVTVTKNKNQTTSNISITAKIPQALNITFKAPKGSTVSAGVFSNYYIYNFFETSSVTEDENGVTAVFTVPDTVSGNTFYRVQNPNGVTYWQFEKWSAPKEITVTESDLHIGDSSFTKNSVFRFEKNVYDRADIYLNINEKGYMNMEVGESYELNVFRNWMAIENLMNSKVALPDMHYKVVDAEGNPSDVVTVTPDKNNSSVANMVANKEGMAKVLVTYDAMTHMQGQSNTASKEFSAIWPECTGVFAVTVGADGSSVNTNMTIDRIDSAESAIDAEHDIIFYLGDSGASYSFTPEAGSKVSVDRSVAGKALFFTGFTTKGVFTDKNGEVTVSGLTSGRHIIKVEKDGKATYQVITTRKVSYTLYDSEGNALDFYANRPKAGDTVKVQFTNLVNPAEKLSGAYNFNASLYYKAEDETVFRSKAGSPFGVYDFSGNPVRQFIEITIPADWNGDSYSLEGAIKMGGFGNTTVGGHRGITYAVGMDRNFNAPTAKMVLSRLPELSIPIANDEYLANRPEAEAVEKMIDAIGEVTLNSKSAINAARAAYKALTANQKELVSNYGVLLDAIAAYEELTGGEGTIHIGASEAAASNGEENPNTGAEVFGA